MVHCFDEEEEFQTSVKVHHEYKIQDDPDQYD